MKEDTNILAGHSQAIKIAGVRVSHPSSLSKSPPKPSGGAMLSTSPPNTHQALGPAKHQHDEHEELKEVSGDGYPRP